MGFQVLPNTFKRPQTGGDTEAWTSTNSPREVTDFTSRVVSAPTDLSDQSRYRRSLANLTVACGHETTAAFSAESTIPLEIVEAVDAARVSGLLDAINTTSDCGLWDDYHSQWDTETNTDISESAEFVAPPRLPKGALEFYEEQNDIVSAYLTIARSVVGGNGADATTYWDYWHNTRFDETDPKAPQRHLYRQALHEAYMATSHALCESEPTDEWLCAHGDERTTEETAAEVWARLSRYLNEEDGKQFVYERAQELPDDTEEYGDEEDTEWCNMLVVEPPLSLPLNSKTRRNHWRLSDEGAFIKRPDRFCTDGHVFGSKRRNKNAGSVLIDCSGSMSLSDEDITFIMENSPGVTIATYCSSAYTGYLHIVAKKGKRAAPEDLQARYGGNGCDGPALTWLGKQPEPRVWICDGHVTGIHDQSSRRLTEECRQIVKAKKVQTIDSMYRFRTLNTETATRT